VTLHQTSSFLAAARTGLRCESSLLRTGRSVLYGTASTWDSAGTLVSHHAITYLRPDGDRPERSPRQLTR
jgi:acyl-coenzyme A thioesterase PaaI-like protein